MAKTSKTKDYKTKNIVLGVLLLILGVLIIFWPLLLVNDIRDYPSCVALDLFPINFGYVSDSQRSFLYFIQLPLTVIGSILSSYAIIKLRILKYSHEKLFIYFIGIFAIIIAINILLRLAGIDLSYNDCLNYKNVLPDLNLIINSRN